MLYYLFHYLEQFDFPGARMFGYVSFRSLMAVFFFFFFSSFSYSSLKKNTLKYKQMAYSMREGGEKTERGRLDIVRETCRRKVRKHNRCMT